MFLLICVSCKCQCHVLGAFLFFEETRFKHFSLKIHPNKKTPPLQINPIKTQGVTEKNKPYNTGFPGITVPLKHVASSKTAFCHRLLSHVKQTTSFICMKKYPRICLSLVTGHCNGRCCALNCALPFFRLEEHPVHFARSVVHSWLHFQDGSHLGASAPLVVYHGLWSGAGWRSLHSSVNIDTIK